MSPLFPILIIAIGIAVLTFGKRLAVLGAAVGALLGLALLRIIPGTSSSPLLALLIPILLAVIGFFAAGFAKGIVNIVLIVLGALAGAEIMLGFLDLFGTTSGLLYWLLALIGGVIGVMLVQRFKEWAMIILAGLVGGLLVTRGLTAWMPFLQGAVGSLLVLVLAAGSILYQGQSRGKR
jgi:hypothetical protein